MTRTLTSGANIAGLVDRMVHSVETQKEVWIILGRGFPIDTLLSNAIGAGRLPEYHTVQLIYLLQSCAHQIASVGAKLRVFSVGRAPQAPQPLASGAA